MGLTSRVTASKEALDVEAGEPLLPSHDEPKIHARKGYSPREHFVLNVILVPGMLLMWILAYNDYIAFPWPSPGPSPLPDFIEAGMKQCKLNERGPPSFKPFTTDRKKSDRFVEGTKPVWLKNATIWTGEKHGEEVLYGADIYLAGGVIRHVGKSEEIALMAKDAEEVELDGAWVTPGIVDMHNHMGVGPAPDLSGGDSTNSLKAPILPWLRSLDGFNTHDASFNLSISGGLTTMLVLPGSAGNIGGQAFTPRWTHENTPQSMQVEPPFVIHPHSNDTWVRTGAWRHTKHACGENPLRVYGNTRLDSAYDFRRAYNEGKQLMEKQDRWCASPKTQTEPYPDSLEWEVLADSIRGNVKVNVHCYETVDLNDMVRISNEFKFHIAAFHHAHETYLVPDLLKQTYGGAPDIALFASNARYKREAYRGSVFAPKVLADAGLTVAMKSDHAVLDSRHLIYEAAQAHHYGLNFSYALSTVTTHSARSIGLDHRVGYLRPGYDADVVVWDSFPLTIGATPKQTYIDGIAQIIKPHALSKPAEAQEITEPGNWEEEIAETLATRGDPDLRKTFKRSNVIFTNVNTLYLPEVSSNQYTEGASNTVVVIDGKISCVGECEVAAGTDFEMIDLKGGSITPGLISAGSYMGMMEIRQEESTQDGVRQLVQFERANLQTPYDATLPAADVIDGILVRAVDGVAFESKDQLFAYREGVTTGVAFPISTSMIAGLSVAYSTSAIHGMSPGAILNPAGALHLNLNNHRFSVSTKIAAIRRLLAGELNVTNSEITEVFKDVKRGDRRVVIAVDKADTMAALIRLKRESAPGMRMTFLGGRESWMVAEDLAREDIGVVVSPARSFPTGWDQRRIMPGPPLSKFTLPAFLASKQVHVGLGVHEEWMARNTRQDAAWEFANAPDVFDKQAALDLVSSNLEELLGLSDRERGVKANRSGWVAWEGDWASLEGRVRAVRAEGEEMIDVL